MTIASWFKVEARRPGSASEIHERDFEFYEEAQRHADQTARKFPSVMIYEVGDYKDGKARNGQKFILFCFWWSKDVGLGEPKGRGSGYPLIGKKLGPQLVEYECLAN